MTIQNVLLSWSSGKDAAWALQRLRQQSDVSVVGLLTTFNEQAKRAAMHGVRKTLVEAQAVALGLPLFQIDLPAPCPNEIYEAKMAAFVEQARRDGITHIAFGDLFLEDIRRYREEKLAGSGIEPLFPLFGADTGQLAREIVDSGTRAYLTCVDPQQLDPAFVGRAYDHALLAEMGDRVDPCGENGEFHTFVWDGPMFSRALNVQVGITVERDGFFFADVAPCLESNENGV